MDDAKITPSKGMGNLAQAKIGMHRKSEPIDKRTGLKLKEKKRFFLCMYVYSNQASAVIARISA